MSKSKINWGKTGLFAAGVAFGTAGIKFYQARTQRSSILTARQQFLEQRIVL